MRWLSLFDRLVSLRASLRDGKKTRRPGRRAPLGSERLEDRLAPAIVPVQQFYVPLAESDLRSSFVSLYSGTGQQINSVISLATSSTNTLVIYDQWEDGYEADVTNPTQSTTQIWGD